MPNSHVATSYVAVVINLNFDIWRPKYLKWPWLDKDVSYILTCRAQRYSIYAAQVFRSPKYHSVSLYDHMFSSQLILRQVHRVTPKWPRTLQGGRYHINMLLVSLTPIFQSFSQRKVHRTTPRWPWTLQGQRNTILKVTNTPTSLFSSFRYLRPVLSSYRAFWDKCTI